jgi:hypothetical protein
MIKKMSAHGRRFFWAMAPKVRLSSLTGQSGKPDLQTYAATIVTTNWHARTNKWHQPVLIHLMSIFMLAALLQFGKRANASFSAEFAQVTALPHPVLKGCGKRIGWR